MLAVGITGGIGSGKSALADLLVERGATLIDADVIAREVVAPPSDTLDQLVEHFGTEILDGEGHLDRKVMASKAFGDPEALEALNRITHPVIGSTMAAKRKSVEDAGGIALYAIPLYTKEHKTTLGLDCVVVVDCPPDLALERLISQRQFDRDDASARIEAQISRDERRKFADYLIENDSDRDHLVAQAENLWSQLVDREKRNG